MDGSYPEMSCDKFAPARHVAEVANRKGQAPAPPVATLQQDILLWIVSPF